MSETVCKSAGREFHAVCLSQGVGAVKLCTNKILQFLTGGAI